MNLLFFIIFKTAFCVFLKHNDSFSDDLARELQAN